MILFRILKHKFFKKNNNNKLQIKYCKNCGMEYQGTCDLKVYKYKEIHKITGKSIHELIINISDNKFTLNKNNTCPWFNKHKDYKKTVGAEKYSVTFYGEKGSKKNIKQAAKITKEIFGDII